MREKARVFLGIFHKFINQLETVLNFIQWDKIFKTNDRVVLKPNFTFPQHKKGVTTSPRLIEELIKIIKTKTAKIVIGEGEGGYNVFSMEEAFDRHGRRNLILPV